MIELEIRDLDALGDFADRLVGSLSPSLAMGLVGTLGAGKTTLVQSLARSLGIDVADVTSPTFTLLQSHQGVHGSGEKVTLNHLDAYRVHDDDEFLELGVDELFDTPNQWTIVEWADRVRPCMPAATLWIKLSLVGDSTTRRVKLWTEDSETASALDSGFSTWI